MIESLHQIDFITAAGTVRLLDIGAIVESEPAITTKQATQSYAPGFTEWREHEARQGADASASWVAVRDHASQAELRGACMRHAASLPVLRNGTLRITISGGEVWDIERCTVTTSAPLPLDGSATFETVTAYEAIGGRLVPAEPLTLYAGIPLDWVLQEWDALAAVEWDALA